MKHLIIFAHPNPDSFNHQILETVIDKLTLLGATVEVRDLYKLNFNPCYSLADIRAHENGDVLPDVKVEQDYLRKADKVTFIAPIWWEALPAMLKGYFDRVFNQGFAYTQVSDGWQGLLGAKKFGMINTVGATKEEMLKNGDTVAFKHTIEKGIFDFVASPLCFHQIFFNVDASGREAKDQMLEETKKIIEQFVLDPNYCPYFG